MITNLHLSTHKINLQKIPHYTYLFRITTYPIQVKCIKIIKQAESHPERFHIYP